MKMKKNKHQVVINIQYTPFKPSKNISDEMKSQHESERSFYDMTGEKNVFDYITTEGKRTGKLTMFEYLQKNTGVFNQNGMIPESEIIQMKERAKNNTGGNLAWVYLFQ